MGVTEVAVTVLALGLEASLGTQDPKFLLLRLLRAHGEFTEHYDNTGDGLSSGCPRLSRIYESYPEGEKPASS